jgi:addiction module RelB/DinJ family antitoxin
MKTIINIKADKDIKERAKSIAAELGIPLSTVINAYLKEFVRNREINFSAVPRMSRELERLVGRAEKDLKAKKNVAGPFGSARDAMAYLNRADA